MAVQHCKRTRSHRNTLFTIGHSVLPLADFLRLLTVAAPRVHIVDVRSQPRSRRPWFNREKLSAALTDAGHAYTWMPALGGRQETSFLAYMDTRRFDGAIACVLNHRPNLDDVYPLVLLCAESDPEKCHRWLIATELTAHGKIVAHVLPNGTLLPHTDQL